MRRQVTNREIIFVKETSDKGLLSKIYTEHLKLNNKKRKNLSKNLKILIHSSPKTYTYINEAYEKLLIKEIQIKTTMNIGMPVFFE